MEERDRHEHHHEDCGCGHDHDHQHMHGGEEHEHAHDGILISHHELSLVGSMCGTLDTADLDEGEAHVTEKLKELGRRVTEAGGIIGHIKFIVASQGLSSQISVTDETENIRRFHAGNCRVEGVAIVFQLEDDELRAMMRETIGKVLTVS